jgi:hypothetical protein
MIRNIGTFIATALAIAAFPLAPNAAVKQSYSGNWPVALSQSQIGGKATYCLTLTDNGTAGRPHSGPASLAGVDAEPLTGTFQLIGKLVTVTIQEENGTGGSAGLVFVAPASDGDIGTGVFDLVDGGEELNSAVAVFGAKNGC